MKIFNLAEELEKERKKNEKLVWELVEIKSNFDIQLEYDEQLEKRIDKAIEYIEKNSYTYAGLEETEVNKLLNILKGSDNND